MDKRVSTPWADDFIITSDDKVLSVTWDMRWMTWHGMTHVIPNTNIVSSTFGADKVYALENIKWKQRPPDILPNMRNLMLVYWVFDWEALCISDIDDDNDSTFIYSFMALCKPTNY